jgi:hypothetical protein
LGFCHQLYDRLGGWMTTRLVLASVLALLLVTTGGATTPSMAQPARKGSCPASQTDLGLQGIGTTARIVAAVRRGVPRIFRDFTTQGGGPGWHHYQVEP